MNGTTKPAAATLIALSEIFRPLSLRDRRGREAGQRHRRRQVGHDAEIEHEHVADDQRHAECQQRRPGDRRGDDVVRDRRDAHAEDQAGQHRQEQRQEQAGFADRDDELAEGSGDAGQRQRADDDADQAQATPTGSAVLAPSASASRQAASVSRPPATKMLATTSTAAAIRMALMPIAEEARGHEAERRPRR